MFLKTQPSLTVEASVSNDLNFCLPSTFLKVTPFVRLIFLSSFAASLGGPIAFFESVALYRIKSCAYLCKVAIEIAKLTNSKLANFLGRSVFNLNYRPYSAFPR